MENDIVIPESGEDPWAPTVARFSGYAREYDAVRPEPPAAMLDFLCDLSGRAVIDVVVDLGCGPGTSTRPWAERAGTVYGIDLSYDQIAQARRSTEARNVSHLCRPAHDTGLPEHCADIVTCGMSLHWMDPELTATELKRIIRPGGVFGTFWERWASQFVEVDQAYQALGRRLDELAAKTGASTGLKRWPKRTQERLLASCGLFQFTKEIAFHTVSEVTPAQLVQTVKTLGAVMVLVKKGLSEDEIGLTDFDRTVANAFGSRPRRIYRTWGLWYGVARA